MGQTLHIDLPAIDVARGMDVTHRLLAGFGKLWEAGRLRALVGSREGSELVGAFEGVMKAVREQYSAAVDSGSDTVRLRLSIPAERARDALIFVRQLIGMLSDDVVMSSVSGDALTKGDIEFMKPYMSRIETRIAGELG